jgi:hypothetical protein
MSILGAASEKRKHSGEAAAAEGQWRSKRSQQLDRGNDGSYVKPNCHLQLVTIALETVKLIQLA